jgi:hypothetical protein
LSCLQSVFWDGAKQIGSGGERQRGRLIFTLLGFAAKQKNAATPLYGIAAASSFGFMYFPCEYSVFTIIPRMAAYPPMLSYTVSIRVAGYPQGRYKCLEKCAK